MMIAHTTTSSLMLKSMRCHGSTPTSSTVLVASLRSRLQSTLNDGTGPRSAQVAAAASTTSTTTIPPLTFKALLSKVLAWYSKKLDTHPLLTKGISSGLIAATGDFLCQSFMVTTDNNASDENEDSCGSNNKNNKAVVWDPARTARFGFLGACLVAPCIHLWYGALSARIPGTNVVAVAQRVVCDQFFYTPLFLPVWLTSLWGLEGHQQMNVASVGARLQESMPVVMMANWVLWIPAQSFNFAMVPLRYQVLYSNVVALLWNVYLSHSQTSKGSVMDELDEVVPT